MIELLHINEYVYLKDIDIYFSEGLNVITGETGTGKSLLLDIIGAFVDYGNVRSDVFSADIVLDIDHPNEEYGISSGQHIFSVEKKGKKVFYKIDGKLVPKDIVQNIVSNIITIHKQNSHMKLLEKSFILEILDNIAQHEEKIIEYKELYQRYNNIIKMLSVVDKDKLIQEIEELRQKISEVDSANLSVEEEEELENAYKKASNIQTLLQNYNLASQQLEETESVLRKLYSFLEEKFHNELDKIIESVAELENSLSKELIKLDEVNIEDIENRLWVYKKIRRKYGPTTEDVLENLSIWKKTLEEKEKTLSLIENADYEKSTLEDKLYKIAEEISLNRKKSSEKIISEIQEHLKDLNMNARIDFSFSKTELSSNGIDEVELVGSTLSAGPLYPLRKIVSGGELSRLMLALELSTVSTPVLIYDEIDSGVGGKTAVKLSEKLERLAKEHQIIIVTHLPQIALRAEKHFSIVRNGDSVIIKELNDNERNEEIKRMFGGEEIVEKIK